VAGLLRDRRKQAQAVLKVLGGRADLGPDVVRGEAFDGQAVNDPQGQWLERRACKGILNLSLYHLAHVDHFTDFRDGPLDGIGLKELPIRVVADESGLVRWDIVIEAAFDLGAQGL